MANNRKPQLPKAVLEMKFMKKTRERIEKEIENTDGLDNLYSDAITNEMRSALGNYISEPSFIYCEELIEGRMSFKGMNPEIERLMELRNQKNPIPTGEMDKDISDEILAKKMKDFNKRKRQNCSPANHSVIKRKK